ncbi:MAG: PIN domain-containing protein, partial [Pseudomonadota bacterium]
MIILDTNIISELMRPKPEASVVAWLNAQDENEIATTTITEAELRYGICRLPHGRKREQIQVTVEQILREFSTDRILPFDQAAAREYG